jgi:hypothetical protein
MKERLIAHFIFLCLRFPGNVRVLRIVIIPLLHGSCESLVWGPSSLRNRNEIVIETVPDALDQVQLMGERELAAPGECPDTLADFLESCDTTRFDYSASNGGI